MHKPMRRLVISLIAVAMVVVAGWIVFQFVTEQNREIRLAKIKESPSVAAYNELARRLDRDREDSSAPVSQVEGQRQAESRALPDDAEEIIAGYERLFAHMDQRLFAIGSERGQELGEALGKRASEWTEADNSLLGEFILANQPLIREIREMAQQGGPVHPLDFSKGFSMDVSHLAKVRQCARLLRADAVIKAAGGNYSEAVEDVIAGMKLADALAQEPVLISQIKRIETYGIMTDALQQLTHGGEYPPHLASQLLAHIEHADNRAAFAESLTGQQVAGLQAFEEILRGEVDVTLWPSSYSEFRQTVRNRFRWLYFGPLGKPWVNMDESAYADIMTRVQDAAGLPYYEAHPQLMQIDQDIENLPSTRLVSQALLPALSRAWQAQARHEATIDLMQMGLLLEQYQGQHGSYPQGLDAIAPGLGGELPVEPYTGEPYHYEASDDGFLLYSVGDNLTDDGGVQHDPRRGDIIWRGEYER